MYRVIYRMMMWNEILIPIAVGLIAGICGGFWSIGAGWAVTPVLLLLGVSPTTAVAATAAHIALKSIPAVEERMAALDWRKGYGARALALWIVLPGAVGTVLVNIVWKLLMTSAPTGHAILDWGYVIVLSGIGVLGLLLLLGLRKETTTEHTLARGAEGIQHFLVGVGRGFLSLAFGIGGGILTRGYYAFIRRGLSEKEIAAVSQIGVLVASMSTMSFYWGRGELDWGLTGALALGGIAGQTLGEVLHTHSVGGSSRDKAIGWTFLMGIAALLVTNALRMTGHDFAGSLSAISGAAITSGAILLWFFRWGSQDTANHL